MQEIQNGHLLLEKMVYMFEKDLSWYTQDFCFVNTHLLRNWLTFEIS